MSIFLNHPVQKIKHTYIKVRNVFKYKKLGEGKALKAEIRFCRTALVSNVKKGEKRKL